MYARLRDLLEAEDVSWPTLATNLPDLPNFQSRGKAVDDMIQHFILHNYDGWQGRDKHDHGFLYIIGGSGYGKTWLGWSVPYRIATLKGEGTSVIHVYIDFTNDRRTEPLHGNKDCSVSLGFRVAAKLFFKTDVHTLLARPVVRANLHLFTFADVMSCISELWKQIQPQNRLLFNLHLDEMQGNPDMAQGLLHVIGNYMCSTDPSLSSIAVQHNVVMFPVITGTSQKGMKTKVMDYSSWNVPMVPWTLKESLSYLNIFFNSGELESPRMNRLVACCGGIPRILDYLRRYLSKLTKPSVVSEIPAYFGSCVGKVTDGLLLTIEGLYKVSDWRTKFVTVDNMKMILAFILVQRPVARDVVLSDGTTTVADIEEAGVIFLSQATGSLFKLAIPQLIIHMLNTNNMLFPTINLLDPLSDSWDWSRFEEFEVQFDGLKTDLLCLLGNTALLSDMYTTNTSAPLQGKAFVVTPTTIMYEQEQFLPKEGTANPSATVNASSKGGLVTTIQPADLFKYQFKCRVGNPFVDSRNYRKADPADSNQLPWLIIKQSIHTVAESHITLKTLNDRYSEFCERIAPYRSHYRCVYIVITNRPLSQQDNDTFLAQHSNQEVVVISPLNLDQYLSPTLASYVVGLIAEE